MSTVSIFCHYLATNGLIQLFFRDSKILLKYHLVTTNLGEKNIGYFITTFEIIKFSHWKAN